MLSIINSDGLEIIPGYLYDVDSLYAKIPKPRSNREFPMKLPRVDLPYPGKTYQISFGDQPPVEIYMPRSRTFDDMLAGVDNQVIEYNLSSREQLVSVINGENPDGYILNFLDIVPTRWKLTRENIITTFTTLGSIFHGDLLFNRLTHNYTYEYDTVCEYDVMITPYVGALTKMDLLGWKPEIIGMSPEVTFFKIGMRDIDFTEPSS